MGSKYSASIRKEKSSRDYHLPNVGGRLSVGYQLKESLTVEKSISEFYVTHDDVDPIKINQ